MALPPAGASPSDPIRILDVAGDEYRQAFELFLAGSDEKAVTHARLRTLVEQLPRRSVFVDIGAGSGATTRYLGRYFQRTIAIEPGEYMRTALRLACPDAEVLGDPVEAVELPAVADFALCSHMLYYLPEPRWLPTVRRMLGWVRPGGELVLALQNPENECMRLVRHFFDVRFDLSATASALRAADDGLVEDWSIETLPVRFRADNLADTLAVAEFMVNVPDLATRDPLPSRKALEHYVLTNCAEPNDSGFSIGHDHDIVRIRRSSRASVAH